MTERRDAYSATWIPETRAMEVIVTVMGTLNPEEQKRVITWAFDKYACPRPAEERS